jgi:hypothetical protein
MKGNNDMNEKKKIKMKMKIKILEHLKTLIANYKGVYELPDVTGKEPKDLESYTIGFSDGADAIVELMIENTDNKIEKGKKM